MDTIPVYVEAGTKRVFAGALDWPGWCVPGRDQAAALVALVAAGPRYAALLKGTRLGFKAPKDTAALRVVETLKGNATTDFGAPNLAPRADAAPVSPADLRRFARLFSAGWAGLEAAAEAARGQELTKGPRGGGRSLDGILAHVLGAQAGYLSTLGWKAPAPLPAPSAGLAATTAALQAAIQAGLAASARGELAPKGPRGGQRWSARYFVRRSLWHIVDHVWEIENRTPLA